MEKDYMLWRNRMIKRKIEYKKCIKAFYMNILVYGGKGWIGSQFTALLKKAGLTYHLGTARVDNIEPIKNEVAQIQPTHIVSFIGRTHGQSGEKYYYTIDYLEQTGKLKENVRDNLFSPLVLGILCKKMDIHLTYLGTGCIFKYDREPSFWQRGARFY